MKTSSMLMIPLALNGLLTFGSSASEQTQKSPREDTTLTERRVEELLSRMTLGEKVGQMTQVENNSIKPDDITSMYIGSILSGGDAHLRDDLPQTWADMVTGYQRYALKTRLGIPLIFGVDAVHGHGHVYGATIFPHNIGLGATRDSDLVEKIGRATAEEMAATGIRWNFGPVVAVPQDIRWGRTYEAYGEKTDLVSTLSAAYIRGLQSVGGEMDLRNQLMVVATPKHFLGDGGTSWGTSMGGVDHHYKLDQGDMRLDEPAVRALFLPPYQTAVKVGAQVIMISFNSWKGVRMHAQRHWLTEVLKGELEFKGFLISDWGAIDQISSNYYQAVVTAINAGVDMAMVPTNYVRFVETLTQAVQKGDVPLSRINDAVRRILTVKFNMGLFEHPVSDPASLKLVGSEAHRALAREAVQKSLVLLMNDNKTLPLARATPLILVAGKGADDIGIMCGGWTITWQGMSGNIVPGTSILKAIKQTVSQQTIVRYDPEGMFRSMKNRGDNAPIADVGIIVVGEMPYAEGLGDEEDLSLSKADAAIIQRVKERSRKVVVITISGRPLVVTNQLVWMDALVAAWLPGTEGQGVADALFGDAPFTGKLPFTWPRWTNQLPFNFENLPSEGGHAPLFPYGYGLSTTSTSPNIPMRPEK